MQQHLPYAVPCRSGALVLRVSGDGSESIIVVAGSGGGDVGAWSLIGSRSGVISVAIIIAVPVIGPVSVVVILSRSSDTPPGAPTVSVAIPVIAVSVVVALGCSSHAPSGPPAIRVIISVPVIVVSIIIGGSRSQTGRS